MDTLGYSIYGHDNDSYMFIDGHPFACNECGSKLVNTYNPVMKLKKKTFDVSCTYDGYTIISKRFLDFVIGNKYNDLEMYPLVKYPDFFFFNSFSLNLLKFDSERRKVEYTGACELCAHNPAYGSTPTYLKDIEKPVERGFFRTDILFSDSGKERPQIILGIETYEELKAEKFKGVDFQAIKK